MGSRRNLPSALWRYESIARSGRAGETRCRLRPWSPCPRAAGIVGQLGRARGGLQGCPRGVSRPRWAPAFEQRRSRPGCVPPRGPFSLGLWHFIAGSPSGAGDAELAGAEARRPCAGPRGARHGTSAAWLPRPVGGDVAGRSRRSTATTPRAGSMSPTRPTATGSSSPSAAARPTRKGETRDVRFVKDGVARAIRTLRAAASGRRKTKSCALAADGGAAVCGGGPGRRRRGAG